MVPTILCVCHQEIGETVVDKGLGHTCRTELKNIMVMTKRKVIRVCVGRK